MKACGAQEGVRTSRNEQEAIKIGVTSAKKRGLALSLNEMARAQASLSNNKDAPLNFEEALQIRREIGNKRGLVTR